MKSRITKTFILLLLSSMAVYSNTETDILDIQKTAARVPRSKSKNPYVLAIYLTEKYEDDASKSSAISYWISNNIKYDYKRYKKHRLQLYNSEKVLKKRKAVCEEYSNLYIDMCESVGIKALEVTGYTRGFDFLENDTIYGSAHLWNISLINDEWQLNDHTFAAGAILFRNQPLKRYTLGLVGIPYKPKQYFKKQYDNTWINVNPNRMIQTHFPSLSMFQLLQNPITVSDFSQKTTIKESMPISDNLLINNYVAMPFQIRMIYSAQQVIETNRLNSKIAGYHYFLCVDDYLKKHYNFTTKSFNTSVDDLLPINKYAFFADSLFNLSKTEIDANYRQKQRQSQHMRNELKTNNKAFIDVLQKRIKDNQKNINTSTKLQKKSKQIKKYYKIQNKKIVSQKPAKATKRTSSSKNTDNEKTYVFLSKLDSIQNKVVKAQLTKIDSLNAFYTAENIAQNVLSEQSSTAIYETLLRKLKVMENLCAGGIPPMFHKFSLFYLYKRELTNDVHYLDSLKKQHVDKMMPQLLENQKLFFELTKQYTKSTTESIKYLNAIKKNSTVQYNVDNHYLEIIAEYKSNLSKFTKYSEVYVTPQKDLVKNLKSQNKTIAKKISRLKKENKKENYRYMLYDEYLKDNRRHEKKIVKSFQNHFKKYKKRIDKSLEDNQKI